MLLLVLSSVGFLFLMMEQYRIEKRIGKGAHGVVFLGMHVESGKEVALKKVLLARLDDGIPTQVIREIRSLCQLSHENVVKLHDVFPSGMGIMLCFEFMPSDLAHVLQAQEQPLSAPHVKRYMNMLLSGVDYCHSHGILHRVRATALVRHACLCVCVCVGGCVGACACACVCVRVRVRAFARACGYHHGPHVPFACFSCSSCHASVLMVIPPGAQCRT